MTGKNSVVSHDKILVVEDYLDTRFLIQSQTGTTFIKGSVTSDEFIIICDEGGTITELSQTAANMFGRDGRNLLGSNIESLAPHWHTGTPLKQWKPNTPQRSTSMNNVLVTLSHPSGGGSVIEAVLIPLLSRGQFRYAVVPRTGTPRSAQTDPSELPPQMELLLSQRLVRSVEASLTQASRDIHDGVSQSMSNAVQILQAVGTSKRLAADQERISRVLLMLREGIADARSISRQLMPASLERVGLAKTLKFEFENLALVGVMGSFSFRVAEPIPPHVEIALYRIASEALLNVKKHAQAGAVTLRVKTNRHLLTMKISDNGVGFDREYLSEETQTRLGLLSMEARARLIGGTFDLVTSPGNGTLITVELPTADNTRPTPSDKRHVPSSAVTPKKRLPAKAERESR
jgi:signal transduction histidine kinase